VSDLLQYVFSGITIGSVYAVVAIGLSMLYRSTELINFAHGEFAMFGALGLVTLWGHLHLPLPLAFVLAVAGVACVGMVFERFALRTVKDPNPITLVIITVGASIVFRGVAMKVWGKDPVALPPFSDLESIEIAGAVIVPQSLYIVGAALVLAGTLHLFFRYTIQGKAMTACAVNKTAAWLTGIPSERMGVFAVLISAVSGAVAGIFIAPVTMNTYDMGTMLGLKGFCAAMIGGLGSLWGAFAGGILLGVLESLGAGLISSGAKDAIAFVLLLLILYLCPGGLFAQKSAERF
jgi:branched-chain amino acid transport system permease protein